MRMVVLTKEEDARLDELMSKAACSDAAEGCTNIHRGYAYIDGYPKMFNSVEEIDEYFNLVNRKYGLGSDK